MNAQLKVMSLSFLHVVCIARVCIVEGPYLSFNSFPLFTLLFQTYALAFAFLFTVSFNRGLFCLRIAAEFDVCVL